jgi:transposase
MAKMAASTLPHLVGFRLEARFWTPHRRIKRFNDELTQRARTEDAAKRLTRIPGIGVLTATALIAAVGNAQTFTCGRDLAAWLGLVPRQATTGGKPKLLRISKRGNGYLRMLLIHGARTALPGLAKKRYSARPVA